MPGVLSHLYALQGECLSVAENEQLTIAEALDSRGKSRGLLHCCLVGLIEIDIVDEQTLAGRRCLHELELEDIAPDDVSRSKRAERYICRCPLSLPERDGIDPLLMPSKPTLHKKSPSGGAVGPASFLSHEATIFAKPSLSMPCFS